MSWKVYHSFFLFFIATFSIYAQTTTEFKNVLSYRMGYGFITAHDNTMLYYTGQHISHHEVTFEKSNFLNTKWQQEFPKSNFGYGISYYDFSTDVLGSALSVYPYLNFSLWSQRKLQWKLRTAIGCGLLTQPYDEKTNYKNSAIGSRFNLYFNFLTELRWRFSNQFSYSLALDFGHFSNTSFQKPNLGINIPTLNTGMIYYFGEKKVKNELDDQSFIKPKAFFEFTAGIGANEIHPANGNKYFVKSLSLNRVHHVNAKSSLLYGIDFFHNPAITELLKRNEVYINEGWQTTQIGIGIGHYLHVGNFSLGNTLGYYVKNEYNEYTSLYFGISGNYDFSTRTKTFIQLKTHKAEAEYLLVGLRFKLNG